MTCPADDELVRMVEGALGDASLAAIETHVDGCERCTAVVAELGALGPAPKMKGGGFTPTPGPEMEGGGFTPTPGNNIVPKVQATPVLRKPPTRVVRTLASYQLDRRIAAGGMGEVWAAWDPDLEREVAVKLVHPEHADDDRERARLLREARALAKLAHPNVLAVYDVGEVDGEVYIATELVSGDTLASRGGASADWRVVARLYVQAARGLAAAHAVGLVHRDVKPANLLVGADGRVRVADFGLAVRAAAAESTPVIPIAPTEPAVTVTGAIAGTPAYMAPEQRVGDPADARCDQFALALALTEGIDGRRPAAGTSAAALRTQLAERRPIDVELDALCAVLARGLSVDPDARYAEIGAFADAVEAIGDVSQPVTPSVSANAPTNKRALARVVTRTRRRFAVGGITLGAVAIAAAVAIGWMSGSGGHVSSDRAEARTAVSPLAQSQTQTPPPPQPSPTQPSPTQPSPTQPSPTQPSPTQPSPTQPPQPGLPPLHVQPPKPPAQTQPTHVPAPPDHTVGSDPIAATMHGDLEALELAIRHHDARACKASLAQLDVTTLGSADRKRAESARPICEMVAGNCAEGSAHLTTLYAALGIGAAAVASTADQYCPLDDPATRARRLVAQTRFLPAGAVTADCERLVAPARAMATDAHDAGARQSAAGILATIAHCMSANERCDAAQSLLREAGALVPAANNPLELTPACR